MRTAHSLGMRTGATMMYGSLDCIEHRISTGVEQPPPARYFMKVAIGRSFRARLPQGRIERCLNFCG